MSALSGEPWHGANRADVFVTADTTRRDSAWVTTTTGSAQPTGDQTAWTGDPGTSLTLRFKWTKDGLGSTSAAVQAPNFATVEIRLPGSGATFTSTWTLGAGGDDGFPAEDTEVSRTFHFDDDPLNFSAGSARSGMVEVYLNWGSSGGLNPWNVDSRGGGTVNSNDGKDWARGILRSPRSIDSITDPSNVSIGGAEPNPFAFPDEVYIRVTFTAETYESKSLSLGIVRTGQSPSFGTERSKTLAAQTAVNHDFVFTGVGGRIAKQGMFGGNEAKDVNLQMSSGQFGGEEKYVFGTSSGWTLNSDLSITKSAVLTADPRTWPTNGTMAGWNADLGALFHQQSSGEDFGTPPNTPDDDAVRTYPDDAYLSVRFLNAREEGLSGLTLNMSVWDPDVGSESAYADRYTGTTATIGGEAGWLIRDSTKLGLVWTEVQEFINGPYLCKSTITAPSDAVSSEVPALTTYDRDLYLIVPVEIAETHFDMICCRCPQCFARGGGLVTGSAGATSTAHSPTEDPFVGDMWFMVSYYTDATVGDITIADSQSNTWIQIYDQVQGSIRLKAWYILCPPETKLGQTDTITITHPASSKHGSNLVIGEWSAGVTDVKIEAGTAGGVDESHYIEETLDRSYHIGVYRDELFRTNSGGTVSYLSLSFNVWHIPPNDGAGNPDPAHPCSTITGDENVYRASSVSRSVAAGQDYIRVRTFFANRSTTGGGVDDTVCVPFCRRRYPPILYATVLLHEVWNCANGEYDTGGCLEGLEFPIYLYPPQLSGTDPDPYKGIPGMWVAGGWYSGAEPRQESCAQGCTTSENNAGSCLDSSGETLALVSLRYVNLDEHCRQFLNCCNRYCDGELQDGGTSGAYWLLNGPWSGGGATNARMKPHDLDGCQDGGAIYQLWKPASVNTDHNHCTCFQTPPNSNQLQCTGFVGYSNCCPPSITAHYDRVEVELTE